LTPASTGKTSGLVWFGLVWRLDAGARGGHPRRGTSKTVVAVQGKSFEGASLIWFVGCWLLFLFFGFWILFFGFCFFGVLQWVGERQEGDRETGCKKWCWFRIPLFV
jgi:hypothetical protein